ncbi:hypothetical protein D3C87_2198920 [compost metagenome]
MPATAFEPQISYKAHLFGFILGVITGLIYYAFKKDFFKKALVTETVTEVYKEDTPPAAQESPTQNVHFI